MMHESPTDRDAIARAIRTAERLRAQTAELIGVLRETQGDYAARLNERRARAGRTPGRETRDDG